MKKAITIIGPAGLLLIVIGLILYITSSVWDTLSLSFTFAGLGLFLVFLVVRFDLVLSLIRKRTFKYGTNAMLNTLMVLSILVAINYIGSRHEWRSDLTEGAYYSLSEKTKKVIDNLEENIQITGFHKSRGRKQVEDLFIEYASRSNKIQYRLVDGDEDPVLARRYEVTRYPTTVVEVDSRRQVINRNTEETLTNAIVKITRKGDKVIYFLDGHDEKDIDGLNPDGYSIVKEMLQKENYVVKKLSLAIKGVIPQDCAVLVVAGPKSKLLEDEEKMVHEFLNQAGKVIVLVDPEPSASLNEFLEKWGAQANNDLVIDKSGVGRFFGAGPAIPIANDYHSMHPITKDFNVMTLFPQARSVSITSNRDRKLIVTTLIRTSQNSYGETNLISENRSVYDENEDKAGPPALGVAVTKEWRGSKQGSILTEKNAKTSSLVVFGDSDFATNQFFTIVGNGDLFLNAINWLAEEEDLISIRPKNPEDRRVILNYQQLSRIFFIVVFAMPFAAAFFGMIVWWRRRKK